MDYEDDQKKWFIQDELVLFLWNNLVNLTNELVLKSWLDVLKSCVQVVSKSTDPNFNIFSDLICLHETSFYE